MTISEFLETFNGFIIECEDDRFRLFSGLVGPMKQLENTYCEVENTKERIKKHNNTIRTPILSMLAYTVSFTLAFAIPFLIMFYVVSNLVRLADGQSLYMIFDSWAGELKFVKAFLDFASMDGKSLTMGVLMLIPMIVFIYILVPCITLLIPAMFALSIIITIVSCLSAKRQLKADEILLNSLKTELSDAYNKLSPFLYHVPEEYCSSEF